MNGPAVPLATLLERSGVAGRIGTRVGDVHRKTRRLAEGDAGSHFGLQQLLPVSVDEVMSGLEALTGAPVPPETDPRERCWVDPEVVADECARASVRLSQACERGERVLFGTGHPAGPIDLYIRLARALVARGARVEVFAEGEPFDMDGARVHVRYMGSVACVSNGGDLLHTHSPGPMEYLLSTGPTPDLVVGDHGFAGVGLARGAEAVAIVDTNDPALVAAWVRGMPVWPIVCDDGRPPSCYDAMARFFVQHLPPR